MVPSQPEKKPVHSLQEVFMNIRAYEQEFSDRFGIEYLTEAGPLAEISGQFFCFASETKQTRTH